MTQLADAHIIGQQRLRQLVAQTVAAAWGSLDSYDRVDQAPFAETAAKIVLAGQMRSAALTQAFIARSLNAQPDPVDVALVTGAAARQGTDPLEVYRRPFVTVWTMLREGAPYQDAVRAGGARATSAAATDVQLTMRATLQRVGQSNDRIVGYQRVPDGGACQFCQMVAGQRYRTDQLMPIHNHCGCSVDVITGGNRHLFTGNEANDLDVTKDGVTAAVREHGELGPVLTDGAHHFRTGPS